MEIPKKAIDDYIRHLVVFNEVSKNTEMRYRDFVDNLPKEITEESAKTYINLSPKTGNVRSASTRIFFLLRMIHLVESISYGGQAEGADRILNMLKRYQRDIVKRWRREMKRNNEGVVPANPKDLYRIFLSGRRRSEHLKRIKSTHHAITHNQMMIALGLMTFCGNRVDETLGIPMDTSHIEITPKYIRLTASHSKGDSGAPAKTMYVTRNAEVPEVYNLYNDILSYIETNADKSDWVFYAINNRDRHIDYLSAYRKMQNLCKLAGVDMFSFHKIRHFVGSTLSFQLPEKAVRIILNHSNNPSSSLSNRYGKLREDQDDRVVDIYSKAQKIIREEIFPH